MKSVLKKALLGIDHPKEYICTSAGDISDGLNCYILMNGGKIPAAENLLFLGYRPLIMGWITEKFDGKELIIVFERKDNSETIATLKLRLEKEFPLSEKKLFLFKGISSKQQFETGFQQFMFKWYDRFRLKQPGNIDLDPQLYNQVKIAYSIPREIKLVTLGNENGFNVFPTDLHGKAGSSEYIISLRHDKKACAQLMAIGKLALWTVDAKHAAEIYALGKNHSRDLSSEENHSFTGNQSPLFHFPEPVGAIGCEELELEKTIADIDIHRIFLMKSKSNRPDYDPRSLVHLHRSYVQWHIKKGFPFTESKR